MRVRSQLADVDLEVGRIRREDTVLIVSSAEGIGIPTQVDIHPRDAVQILKAVLCSPGALSFLLLFGIGTAVAMSVYALFAGFVAGRAVRFAEWLGRAVGQLTGVSTIIIGVFWLIR